MATPNVLGVYELLRRAMQQQSLQQQGTDSSSTSNPTSGYDFEGYSSTQGGLLGRWLALQAEQSPNQPSAGNARLAPTVSADPNFRQLSRVPAANRTQSTTNASTPSADRFLGVGSAFDSPNGAAQDAYGNRSVAPGIAGLPMMTPVPLGSGLGGMPTPMRIPLPFPIAPGAAPRISMPAIPEAWKIAGATATLLPWIVSRLAEGRESVGNNLASGADELVLPHLSPPSAPALAALSALFGHQMASRKGDDEDDDDPTKPEVGSDEWKRRYQQQLAAQARARDIAGRKAIAASGPDPGNYCTNRYDQEIKECYERSHEYPDPDFLAACRDQAFQRLADCQKHGGRPGPNEPRKWGPDLEEVYRNGWRP